MNVAIHAMANADVRELTTIPVGKRRFLKREAFDQDFRTLIRADPADDIPKVRMLNDSSPLGAVNGKSPPMRATTID